MIVLNPRFITHTPEGLYGQYATDNLNELREIMKDLVIKYPDDSNRAYQWISDQSARWENKSRNTADASVQTSQSGAGLTYKKRQAKVKTFAI